MNKIFTLNQKKIKMKIIFFEYWIRNHRVAFSVSTKVMSPYNFCPSWDQVLIFHILFEKSPISWRNRCTYISSVSMPFLLSGFNFVYLSFHFFFFRKCLVILYLFLSLFLLTLLFLNFWLTCNSYFFMVYMATFHICT